MIQSGGLFTHDSLYLMGSPSPYRMMNSIVTSYVKEFKNIYAKKINNDILVDRT